MTALVGPNGAGKTTLMRCIAGLEAPLSGRIAVAGIDVIAQPRESHRQLGFLADSFGVSAALSVRQTLIYAALAHGATPEAAAVAVLPVAKRLGLADLLDRLCGALSRGQRQRVAIGRALIHRPQLLILDEPASGLDPEARAGLAALFNSLRGEGMTLLVSSHILAELDEYSTHMLMLRDGRVVEHRALTVAAPAAGDRPLRRLRAGLLTAALEAQVWLSREAGLQATLVDARTLELAFGGTDADQAALLARLIGAGFAVSSFAEQRENLQQSYLRSVAGAGVGA